MFKQVKTITVPEKKENSVHVHCLRSQYSQEKRLLIWVTKAEKSWDVCSRGFF